jgi:hypothetical protein
VNRDPIGEAGGENLYAFVGNDPVNRRDLLGLSEIEITESEICWYVEETDQEDWDDDKIRRNNTPPPFYVTLTRHCITRITQDRSPGATAGKRTDEFDDGRADGEGQGLGAQSGETPAEREARRKRCDTLKWAITASVQFQASELGRIAALQGRDPAAYARLATDAGALVESAIDFVAKSDSTRLFNSIRGTRGLEIANRATNIYAGGAALVDVINAYASYVGEASGGFQPDWGGVSYNLGSAGINALSLYLSSPASKGIAANPWTGVAVGTVALAIGVTQEIFLTNIANDAIREARAGYDAASARGTQAVNEFSALNCSEFYGN